MIKTPQLTAEHLILKNGNETGYYYWNCLKVQHLTQFSSKS